MVEVGGNGVGLVEPVVVPAVVVAWWQCGGGMVTVHSGTAVLVFSNPISLSVKVDEMA